MSRLIKCVVVLLLGGAMFCGVSCQTTEAVDQAEVEAVEAAPVEVAVEPDAPPAPEVEPAPEVKGQPIEISVVDLSPIYDWSQDDFDKAYAPEIEGEQDSVEWNTGVKLDNGAIDFLGHIQPRENIAIYARVTLEADSDCKVHLSMGSDDGLAVFVNGEKVFKNNVMRGMTRDQDQADIELLEGVNEVLFRVTQGGGDFSLQVAASVMGDAEVVQVIPEPAVEEEATEIEEEEVVEVEEDQEEEEDDWAEEEDGE